MRGHLPEQGFSPSYQNRRRTARTLWVLPAALALVLALSACATPSPPPSSREEVAWPAVRFAVLSDPHVFDLSRSQPGPALTRATTQGMRLLAESGELLEAALEGIGESSPQFLIVPGDLTRDGERSSHEMAASLLLKRAAAGTRVFVVPGNHDIGNPHAARFSGTAAERAASVTPEEFAAIYRALGYGDALFRDPSSLSYVAEPLPGVWLLGIDSCGSGAKRAHPVSSGRIPAATLAWVRDMLTRARSRGAFVIAFMHHGALEHFLGQGVVMRDALLENRGDLVRLLAESGVRMVFTGHGHAQDIAAASMPGREGPALLLDVETGSTACYPNPYRIVSIDSRGRVYIRSRFVTALPGRPDLASYAEARLRREMEETGFSVLRRIGVTVPSAHRLAASFARGVIAFSRGDEPGGGGAIDTTGFESGDVGAAGLLGGLLVSLETDRAPGDNDIRFELADGAWEPLPPEGAASEVDVEALVGSGGGHRGELQLAHVGP